MGCAGWQRGKRSLEELLTEIDFADDNELEKSINMRTIVQIGDTKDKR